MTVREPARIAARAGPSRRPRARTRARAGSGSSRMSFWPYRSAPAGMSSPARSSVRSRPSAMARAKPSRSTCTPLRGSSLPAKAMEPGGRGGGVLDEDRCATGSSSPSGYGTVSMRDGSIPQFSEVHSAIAREGVTRPSDHSAASRSIHASSVSRRPWRGERFQCAIHCVGEWTHVMKAGPVRSGQAAPVRRALRAKQASAPVSGASTTSISNSSTSRGRARAISIEKAATGEKVWNAAVLWGDAMLGWGPDQSPVWPLPRIKGRRMIAMLPSRSRDSRPSSETVMTMARWPAAASARDQRTV